MAFIYSRYFLLGCSVRQALETPQTHRTEKHRRNNSARDNCTFPHAFPNRVVETTNEAINVRVRLETLRAHTALKRLVTVKRSSIFGRHIPVGGHSREKWKGAARTTRGFPCNIRE